MIYGILGDLVLVVHGAFVLFVIFGGLLACRWKKVLWWHLPAFIWGVLVEWTGWFCPLTPLEEWLGMKALEAGSPGDLTAPFLLPLLYPSSLSRGVQVFLGTAVLFWNLLLYGLLFRRAKRADSGERYE